MNKNGKPPSGPIDLARFRNKKLGVQALDAIAYISEHGNDRDVDLMTKILFLDREGLREVGHPVTTKDGVINACAVLLIELRDQIKTRRTK